VLELDSYTEFHQTMRELLETAGDTSTIYTELDNVRGNLETLFENQRRLIEEMQDKLLRLRMVSFGSLAVRLQRTVRMTADEEGKSAELVIEGENLEIDTQILDALIEPLMHLLRNAVAHGIESPETRRLLGKSETGRIKVSVHDEGTHIILSVSDDGRGISAAVLKETAVKNGYISQSEAERMADEEALALVFLAGLTTSEEISQISGRGVGMNVVKTNIARQQGTISIGSDSHKGTTFTIRLPMALAVTRALLVKAGDQTYAFPLKLVKHISRLSVVSSLLAGVGIQKQSATGIAAKNENEKTTPKDSESSIFYLNELLGLPFAEIPNDEDTPLLLLKTTGTPCALVVDEIIKPEEIIIKPLGVPLQNLAELLGATVLGDGSVVPVLDLIYLLKKKDAETRGSEGIETEKKNFQPKQHNAASPRPFSVLIVDDSPSVRHLTSNIIKDAGWTATIAKDGLEALDILQETRELPDVILTDVEMPRMDGYELLASLKKQENLQAIPVVMITSRAGDKHRQKAVDLGVSEYLIKPFNETFLIEKIKELCRIKV
jgi:chemosensory pili system protein ChpA (sensor histidine kinase/response regulator)